LSSGQLCTPATQEAQEQEDKFQQFLQQSTRDSGIESPEVSVAADSPVRTKDTQLSAVNRSVAATPMHSSSQSTSLPVQRPSSTKRPTKRFGAVGPPLRVKKSSLDAVSESDVTTPTAAPLDRSAPAAAPPATTTEETTQVFFGRVSRTELKARDKVGHVVSSGASQPAHNDTLVRQRDEPVSALPAGPSAVAPQETKRQRISPVYVDKDDDNVTADTIVSFKTQDNDMTADTIVSFKTQPPAPSAPSDSADSMSDVTATADANTIVSFKPQPFKRETQPPQQQQQQQRQRQPQQRQQQQQSSDDTTENTIVATGSSSSSQSQASAAAVSKPSLPPPSRETVSVAGVSYVRLRQIGKGGSSKVYKIVSPEGEILALKEIDLGSADESAIQGYVASPPFVNSD
jgi:hypothetical protein